MDHERDLLRAHVVWLESLQRSMLLPWTRGGGGAGPYHLRVVIEALLMAGNLRASGTFRETIVCALRLALPPATAQFFVDEVVSKATSVPSPTTLYRHRLTLTTGFYSWLAEENERKLQEGSIRYLGIDKSPQGNEDWLMTLETTISKNNLRELFRQAQDLYEMNKRKAIGQGHQEMADRVSELLEVNLAPPVAVGSGRASAIHTLHALAHAHKLVSKTWQGACQLLSNTVAITSDMGTESFLTSLPQVALQSLFPFQSTVQERACDDEEGTLMIPELASSADISHFDLSKTLHFPGLLHILDKPGQSLEKTLSWYAEFHKLLKALTTFLSKNWSKSRFLETCMSGEAWVGHRVCIERFVARAYSPRWGTVWRACRQLLPLQQLLQQVWNIEKYLLRSGEINPNRVDAAASKDGYVHLVDEAIRSNLFWSYLRMIVHLSGLRTTKTGHSQPLRPAKILI